MGGEDHEVEVWRFGSVCYRLDTEVSVRSL